MTPPRLTQRLGAREVRKVTRRQVEVLEAYLVTGSYAAAAARLGISYPTVRNHMSDLRRRLGVKNTAQATYALACSGELPSTFRHLVPSDGPA